MHIYYVSNKPALLYAQAQCTDRKYCGVTVYIPLDLRRYPRYRNHSDHPIIRFPRVLCVNWGSLSSRQSYICRWKRRYRSQSSVWDASQVPLRFVERERSFQVHGPLPDEAKLKLCVWTQFFISRSDAHTRGGWLATLGNRAPCSSHWPSTELQE